MLVNVVNKTHVQVAVRLKELGCYEISLGDTIGVGTPGKYRVGGYFQVLYISQNCSVVFAMDSIGTPFNCEI